MSEVDVDAVAPTVGGRDLCDGTIGRARFGRLRFDPHNGPLGDRLCSLSFSDVDIMAAAVDPIDDEIVAVVQLIG